MPGSNSRWDQHEDPRDNTVDLPRIDVDGLTDYFRRAAPMLEPEPGGLLEPLPEQDSGSAPASPYAPESRSYLTPGSGPPGGLRHPYAEDDEPRPPAAWRAVDGKPTPAVAGEPIPAVAGQPTPAVAREPAPAVAGQPTPAVAGEPTPAGGPPSAVRAEQKPAVDGEPTHAVDGEPTSVSSTRRGAEPDENSVAAALVAANNSALTRLASNRGAADGDAAAPTAAAQSGAASDPAPQAVPAKRGGPAVRAGARDRSHVTGLADRAPVGSLADLRSRLARLPDGHPSSPYEDDGHPRALPIRLKQLELGLPTASREVGAGSGPESDADDNHVDHAQNALDAGPRKRPDGSRQPARPRASKGDPAANAEHFATEGSGPKPSDTPATAEPAADVDSEPTGQSGSSPAQPEWADPYATPDNGHLARTSARPSDPGSDLALGPWQAAPSRRVSGLEGLSPRAGNGHGPANGRGNGSRRRDSLLEPDRPDRRQADADRRDTAEYRTVASSAVDLREIVERTLAASRAAEGRNVFGSYGSSGLTPMMQRIAAHLPFGGLAPGSEANSLKSTERLRAKLARLVSRNPGRTAEELAGTVGDVVRYAFAFETADYVEGTWLVHRRLKSHGFELELRRNRWESPEYKCIFTQWRDPAHQIAFEVQFHTTASWAVLQRTHDAYVQITDPATPSAERAMLRARQVAEAAAAKAPAGAAELGDFRLEAR
jgi:hypothetical protein